MAELIIRFNDFLERYERDVRLSIQYREEILKTIHNHEDFIRDIKPVYAKGMMALGAATLAAIGLGVTWLWNHIRWG